MRKFRIISVVLVVLLVLGLATMAAAAPKADGPSAALDRVFQTVEAEKYVNARVAGWVSTGIIVKSKSPVTVSGSGIAGWAWGVPTVGPAGLDPVVNGLGSNAFLAPGLPKMSLIAKIGDGAPVFIGAGPVTLEGSGELFVAFNDDVCWDNSGGFTAKITYTTMPGNGKGDQQHQHSGPPGK